MEISSIEEEIEMLIKVDQEMNENYELVTGIKGIGPVIATDLLIKTGTPQEDDPVRPKSQHIGPLPNLEKAIANF